MESTERRLAATAPLSHFLATSDTTQGTERTKGIHSWTAQLLKWYQFLGSWEGLGRASNGSWLVVEPTPLKNMSSSVGMMTFPIYGKIKHVPNHQQGRDFLR